MWQDLFLGQEGLVVAAVDNQLERKEEGIATGLSSQRTEVRKNGAVASCLHRVVNLTGELEKRVRVLISKLRA